MFKRLDPYIHAARMHSGCSATRRERVAILLVVVGLLAAALSAPAAGSSSKSAVRWDPKDAPVSDRKTLFKGDQKGLYEPTIAIDPTDPRNMIAFAIDLSAQNVDSSKYYSVTRAYRSTNGGHTWVDNGPVRYGRRGKDVTDGGDPVAVFDDDGTAYYASLATRPGTSEHKWHIYVHRSTNGGATWEKPDLAVRAIHDEQKDSCPGPDKQWLNVDPKTGELLLTYTVFTHACSGPAPLVDLTDIGIYMTTSADRGETWHKPRKIWDGYALGAIPEAAPDGTLYVSFWGTVELPPTACPNAVYGTTIARGGGRPFTAVIAGASKDGGKSWSWHTQPVCDWMAGDLLKPGRFNGGSQFPNLAIDHRIGTAYVAYPSFEPTGRFTIKLLSSSNRGASWAGPVEVTPGLADARMPALVIDAGILHLVYVETTGTTDPENSSGEGTAQTFHTSSCDGGSTWSEPFPLSTKLGQPTLYTQMGDYIDVDVRGNRIAAIWTDARAGTDEGAIWARAGSINPAAAATCRSATTRTRRTARALRSPGGGITPFFAWPHRALPSAAIPTGIDTSCGRGVRRDDLRTALREAAAISARLTCDVVGALAEVSELARRLGYEVAFSEYEGYEAEALIARDKAVLLVKITAPAGVETHVQVTIDPL